MTIEELKKEWKDSLYLSDELHGRVDYYEGRREKIANFALDYMDKLLAVIEAADNIQYQIQCDVNLRTGEHLEPCPGCQFIKKLDDLLESK